MSDFLAVGIVLLSFRATLGFLRARPGLLEEWHRCTLLGSGPGGAVAMLFGRFRLAIPALAICWQLYLEGRE